MLSSGTQGMLLMGLSGLVMTADKVLCKAITEQGWPIFRMSGAVCLTITAGLTAGLLVTRAALPAAKEGMWVLLRGFFGTMTIALLILAVQVGTPIGDIAALTSVNIVVAALLGRTFLGEALRWPHLVAVGCSLAGSVLISRPGFLFGRAGGGDVGAGGAWLGAVLAIVAGFTQACIFLCSRKAAEVSVWIHMLSTNIQCSVIFLLLPAVGAIDDFSLAPVEALPAQAFGWFGLLLADTLLYALVLSAGSKWCPAAASATLSIASWMVSSYAAQVALFGSVPDALTVAGACLMLLGVVVMALARLQAAGAEEAPSQEEPGDAAGDRGTAAAGDDCQSLASFIAAEFVDVMPRPKPVRLRRVSSNSISSGVVGKLAVAWA